MSQQPHTQLRSKHFQIHCVHFVWIGNLVVQIRRSALFCMPTLFIFIIKDQIKHINCFEHLKSAVTLQRMTSAYAHTLPYADIR